jgi:hypothetical protein
VALPGSGGPLVVPVGIGLDPALGGGNAFAVGALFPASLDLLTCRVDYELARTAQIFDILEDYCATWSRPNVSRVSVVVVEDKAFQRGLLTDDRMLELQERYGFEVVPNTTGWEKSDENIGLPGMATSMIRREITWCWADTPSREAFGELEKQLQRWRPNVPGNKLRQDLPMCTWFLWRRWRTDWRSVDAHPRFTREIDLGDQSPLPKIVNVYRSHMPRTRPIHRHNEAMAALVARWR